MKISLILAHPGPGSFNHAIAETARQTLLRRGHTVLFHDLYAEGFDPILPAHEIPKETVLPAAIARHCAEIAAADGIIVVHPNWWGQPPAILKGWIDRVIRPGVAYEFLDGDGEGVPLGLLKAKTAVVFNTSNTPPAPRSERLRGPVGRSLAALHFCPVWCAGVRPPYVRRDRDQHAGAARSLVE